MLNFITKTSGINSPMVFQKTSSSRWIQQRKGEKGFRKDLSIEQAPAISPHKAPSTVQKKIIPNCDHQPKFSRGNSSADQKQAFTLPMSHFLYNLTTLRDHHPAAKFWHVLKQTLVLYTVDSAEREIPIEQATAIAHKGPR